VLTQGELLLDKDMTIKAAGPVQATVSGGGNSRVFEVAANAHVTLGKLAVTTGNQAVNVPDAYYGEGGAILNLGTVALNGSTLAGNFAYLKGGGIFNVGTVTITGSALTDNAAGGYGGGIFNSEATLTISGSVLSRNRTDFEGGGIFVDGGTVTIARSILSGNSSHYGGGIFNFGPFFATISHRRGLSSV
jgi:hypothetical protein